MTKGIIIGLIAILVIGGGGYLALHKSSTKTADTASTTATSASSTKSSATTPAANIPASGSTAPGQSASFTINANDDSADKEAISVSKGEPVSIVFNVDKEGVYHGGLQFKSTDPVLDSGPIAPGGSKTVNFSASKTFSFQPYWYASGVKKDYLITVNVI